MLDYQFVLYFSEKDYNKIVYSDFDNMPGVQIYHGFKPHDVFLEKLHIFHNSERINSKIRLPFKSIWYGSYFDKTAIQENGKQICFVFMFVWVYQTFIKEYIKYLRSVYPTAKFVCYYTDIVSTLKKTPEEIKDYFNLLISYDRRDAEQYNMLYFPTSFSNYNVEPNSEVEKCDVLFLGKAKDRLNKIYTVYNNLRDAGMRCHFYLVDVPQEKQKEGDGLYFLDKPMGYEQYLQHVFKCRCILEIEQQGAVGETLRNWEAIHFGKALLTDNPGIKQSDFYDSRYVSIIDFEGKVDISFVKDYKEYNNPLSDKIRPIKLLEFIQDNLKRINDSL